jgi:hypothetical protein
MGVAALVAVFMAIMAAWPPQAGAQQPGTQTVTPGNAAIWTDQQQYNIGDPIQVCYRIPFPGFITITDLPADGSSRVFYSGPSMGTGACLPGVVTPPPGHECMRLAFPLAGGTGTTQTCFQVVGPTPPPPVSPSTITTDRTSYHYGDPITICYRVPGPGPVTITDQLADGTSKLFFSDFDDGTGGCLPGTVTPPAGVECMILTHTDAYGRQSTAQTCFQVINPLPPPPAGYIFIGTATVDQFGNWTYAGQTGLVANATYVRVTSGGCDDSPSLVAVWEGQMLPQGNTGTGIAVLAGGLLPVGLAANGNASGWGYLQIPLTPSTVQGVSLFLYGIAPVYQGVLLSACLRTA